MRRIIFLAAKVSCLVLSMAVVVFGQGRGGPVPPKPDNPQSLKHTEAAKKIAGSDPFLANPYDFYCITGHARANNNNAPDLEPVKIFDNVYAISNTETTVYVLPTSEGIVLIDSGLENKVETVTVPHLQKLGFDPKNVKYILLGHGHGDHFGGSKYFQDHYGTRVGTTAKDWDLIYPPNPPANQEKKGAPGARPKKDLVLSEREPFKLGELTITLVEIPGHTPGSLGFIFPVKDKGKTRMAGIFGGTILTTNIITTEGLKQYVQSIAHYLDVAKKMKVEAEVQNHPIFDGTPDRLAKLKALKPGEPNPFVIGTDRYLKMWNIISECIQAEVARREGSSE
jgi:metallo-beta-lactamase class B